MRGGGRRRLHGGRGNGKIYVCQNAPSISAPRCLPNAPDETAPRKQRRWGGPQKGSSIPASPPTEPLSRSVSAQFPHSCILTHLARSPRMDRNLLSRRRKWTRDGVTSARSTLDADLRGHLLHSQHDALVVGPSLWDRVPVGSYMHTQQQTCHLELESPQIWCYPTINTFCMHILNMLRMTH